MAYLQAVGTMPPVKITAYLILFNGVKTDKKWGKTYGNATPATFPSTSKRTSRKGPSPNVVPLGRSPRNSLAVLKY